MTAGSDRLHEIGEAYWEHLTKESPYLWMMYGTDKLPDISPEHADDEAAFAQGLLADAAAIRADELTHEEALSLAILRWQLRAPVDEARFYWMAMPVTPYASPLGNIPRLLETHRFGEKQDLDHYLMLVAQYPALIDAVRIKSEEQLRRGLVAPVDELALVIPFHHGLIQPGARSGLLVAEGRLGDYSPQDRKRFREDIADLVDREVNPALQRLVAFLEGPYRAQAPQDVGLWQYPGGPEYYAHLVKMHTTLDVTPEEVHRIGVEQLDMLRERLDAARRDLHFAGNLAEFRQFLRTDPRFFPKTPEEIGARLNGYLDGMREKLPQYFERLPNAGVSARRLPLELEASMTFGYYNPPTATDPDGHYNYNGSNLDQRTMLTAEHLAYHEMLPGHHFHLCLQQENEALPRWRRWAFEGAFNEGWAEYAATLGREMGLYKDPYSWCGRIQSEFFLATRLVVDTGMGAMKWPRARALQVMQENMIESPTQLYTESLRYSVDIPGQALAYRMGYLKIMELRRKVEQALGSRFDVRRLNHALVGSGAMPMPILESHIDWFIEHEGAQR